MCSRELTLGRSKVIVRKPNPSPSGPQDTGSAEHRGEKRHSPADSKLAELYQDTLEAPIPSDMLRLLERIGTGGDNDR